MGVGGGILAVPAFTMLLGMSQQSAQGTSLAVILVTAPAGAIEHASPWQRRPPAGAVARARRGDRRPAWPPLVVQPRAAGIAPGAGVRGLPGRQRCAPVVAGGSDSSATTAPRLPAFRGRANCPTCARLTTRGGQWTRRFARRDRSSVTMACRARSLRAVGHPILASIDAGGSSAGSGSPLES